MVRPSSEELARSGRTTLDPDNIETRLDATDHPGESGPSGPVPEDSQPGHHPAREQDKPDRNAFAARLGMSWRRVRAAMRARRAGRSERR